MAVIHATAQSFDRLISHGTVLVDFWAGWCAPCRMQSSVIDELDRELDGKVTFVKVNVDDYPELSRKYRVLSIPMLVLFRDGEAEDVAVGLQSAEQLRKFIG
ncbi:MAG: thioredoxin [Eubacteriales bacterium]|nr:thioredoxin [Eubacteriales bacterium]